MGKSAGRANASAERFLWLPAAGVSTQESGVGEWRVAFSARSTRLFIRHAHDFPMTALVGTDAAKLPCLSQILNLLCYSSSGNTQLFRKFVIRACWFFGKNLKYFQGTFQGTFLHTFPSTFLRIAPPLLSARSGRHITMRKPLGTSSRSGVLSPLALHTSKRSVNPVPIVSMYLTWYMARAILGLTACDSCFL